MHGFNTIVAKNYIGPAPNHSITIGVKCARSHLEGVHIENNTIVASMQRLLDMGAIYSPGMRNTEVAGNKISFTGPAFRGQDALVASSSNMEKLISDVYFDNVSAFGNIHGNTAYPALLKLTLHFDMFNPIGKIKNVGQEFHRFSSQVHAHNYSDLKVANLCPGGKEDPVTCGCSVDRIQAESVVVNPPVSAPPQTGPVTYFHHAEASPMVADTVANCVLFTPDATHPSVTFTLPSPEAGSATGSAWYNLNIGIILKNDDPSYGKFSIKLSSSAGLVQEYQVGADLREYKTGETVVINEALKTLNGKHSDADRITQHQVLWNIASSPATVKVTFTPLNLSKPIAIDYFEFYRAADKP